MSAPAQFDYAPGNYGAPRMRAAGSAYVALMCSTGEMRRAMRLTSPYGLPAHGPELPTIEQVRAHNSQQDNLGDCIILPPHLANRSYRT